MRNPICKTDWEKVREALMEAQIPFRVTFDSHLNEVTDNANIYYDIFRFKLNLFISRRKGRY